MQAQLPADYPVFLAALKTRIAAARTRAALAVNSELIGLYWEIGREILERERREGWGAKVIERLAADLRREFSDMSGLSRSNLHYMRQMAAAWPDDFPGGTFAACWTSSTTPCPACGTRRRPPRTAGRASPRSPDRDRPSRAPGQRAHDLRALPPQPDSELVRGALKDPYNFEFLNLSEQAKERDLELALLNDVESFLMEMGRGFALVGRQFPLRIRDWRDRRGPRVLHRRALLQLHPAALCGGGPQDRGLQAGVRRQDELLPERGRRALVGVSSQ